MENIIICKFEYNGRNYIIYLNDSNIISYGYMDGKLIKNDLSKEEIKLISSVASKVIISDNPNNYQNLGKFRYNNKEYQIFLDRISGLRFFREWRDGKLVNPHYREISNFIYHLNQNGFLSEKNHQK